MISTTCDRCGIHISASDEATLAWGLESHRCWPAPQPFGRVIRGEDHDAFESSVICWLAGIRGEPFWWFRAGSERAVLVS